jgi:hypothetical protein
MKKIRNNISLVSLHIPKTAGTSFRLVLKENVDPKHFAKLDIFPSGRIHTNDQYTNQRKFPENVRVIHGHFSYLMLCEYFELDPGTEFITWLRDPVQRVLSNYFFLKGVVADRLQEGPDENLFPRIGKTLLEFIACAENQNVMSKFLKGAQLHRFKFIGIQDHYAADLLDLKKMMSWSKGGSEVLNETSHKSLALDEDVLEEIRRVNVHDMALFQEAMELRNKRRNRP